MRLVLPSEKYLEFFVQAFNDDQQGHPGTKKFFYFPPEKVIQQAFNHRCGVDLKPGYVKSTLLWIMADKEFIGNVYIRHELNKNLLRYGGHIGYEIRDSKWSHGYGTKALALALKYAKNKLGITRVLITCDDDNIGSARVIEKNGGVLENKVPNTLEDGRHVLTRRYWIDIQ